MKAATDLVTLMTYKAWADDRLYEALKDVPQTELIARRETILGGILRALNHVYGMDLVWQAHLEGRPHGFTDRRPEIFSELSCLCTAQQEIDAWYIDYATAMDPESARTVVDFEFIGGGAGSMTRSEVLLHVVMHTSYHRGHVTDMMCQIPAQPPITDLPVFLREGGRPILAPSGD